jgi:hypothetical protein
MARVWTPIRGSRTDGMGAGLAVGTGVPAGPKEWRAGTPAATKRGRSKQRTYMGAIWGADSRLGTLAMKADFSGFSAIHTDLGTRSVAPNNCDTPEAWVARTCLRAGP